MTQYIKNTNKDISLSIAIDRIILYHQKIFIFCNILQNFTPNVYIFQHS